MRLRLLLLCAVALLPVAAWADDWGVHPDGGTLYFYTNTVGTDGVAATLASEAVAVYKDGSATELTTGVSIDDDFDSRTGFHQIAIDTTQSGFDAGSRYTVVYTAGTVDSVSVANRIIGTFRLGVVPADVIAVAGTAQTGADLADVLDGIGSEVTTTKDAVTSVSHGNAALKTLIDTIDDYVDTEVAAILADTGTDGVVVAAGSKTGYSLSGTQTFNNTGTWTGNLSGNVTGSVGSVTAGVNVATMDAQVFSDIASGVWSSGGRTLSALDEDTTPLDLDATIRAALGLASANLDTQLADLPTAAENATAAWAAGTRTLTAGTNIVLAKGVGITGFNDLTQQQIRDSLKLAPTAGAPAADSTDDKLNDIEKAVLTE